jgi:photosystem II stability/assembly factor-like uncharacterized protein
MLCAMLVCLSPLAACGGPITAWGEVGPSSDEVILSLVADPHLHSLLYAGGSAGHIYRVTSGSSSTLMAAQGIRSGNAVNSILPDATHPGDVYAASLHGVMVSSDYGQHWRSSGPTPPANDSIESLVFAGQPSTLVAGTEAHGVFISQDSGKTWQASSSGLPANADIYTLYSEPSTHTIFAGLVGSGVYTSHDSGQSWQASAQGIPAHADAFMFAELLSHNTPPTLFVGTSQGLYSSTDGGQTWRATTSKSGLPAGRVLALATGASTPVTLYAGTDQTVYQSTDGGQHWSVVAPGLSTHVAAIAQAQGAGNSAVLFAAAGPVMRTPSQAPGLTPTTFLLAAIGLALLYFYLRRRHSILRRLTSQQEDEQPPQSE